MNEGINFLSGYSEQYHYGLLMFDYEGCGREQARPQDLQTELDQEFTRSAWGDRAKTVVLSLSLRHGSGATLLMWTKRQVGKTGSLPFAIG